MMKIFPFPQSGESGSASARRVRGFILLDAIITLLVFSVLATSVIAATRQIASESSDLLDRTVETVESAGRLP